MSSGRVLACVVAVAVGVFVVGGSLLSIYLEVVGLGRPRDSGIRPGIVAPLVVGVAAGVLVPAAVCAWAIGGSWRAFVIPALVVTTVTAAIMIGIVGMG